MSNDAINTLLDVRQCCAHWERNACIVGNVRAGALADAIDYGLSENERLRARVAELEAAQEWRPIERGDAMKLVNALWGAGYKEGTLEHHPGPSNAMLKKASDASQVAKDALIAALTAPPKVAT